MNRILCSTGALLGRPNGRNYRLLSGLIGQLDCDGYEFMLYESWYPELDAVLAEVGRLGLDIPVLHCDKGLGELLAAREYEEAERRFGLNCLAAERLGAKLLVLHLWNGKISDSCIDNNLAALEGLERLAERQGLTLTVENVVCNHFDPQTHLDRLAASTDARFTFDTKMAAFHGQLDDIFAPEREKLWRDGRIAHIHVNDYGGKPKEWKKLATLHLGDGNIDFENFFGNIKKRNYTGDFTVEATSFDASGKVDIDALNRDFRKIAAFIK